MNKKKVSEGTKMQFDKHAKNAVVYSGISVVIIGMLAGFDKFVIDKKDLADPALERQIKADLRVQMKSMALGAGLSLAIAGALTAISQLCLEVEDDYPLIIELAEDYDDPLMEDPLA